MCYMWCNNDFNNLPIVPSSLECQKSEGWYAMFHLLFLVSKYPYECWFLIFCTMFTLSLLIVICLYFVSLGNPPPPVRPIPVMARNLQSNAARRVQPIPDPSPRGVHSGRKTHHEHIDRQAYYTKIRTYKSQWRGLYFERDSSYIKYVRRGSVTSFSWVTLYLRLGIIFFFFVVWWRFFMSSL